MTHYIPLDFALAWGVACALKGALLFLALHMVVSLLARRQRDKRVSDELTAADRFAPSIHDTGPIPKV